MLVTVSRDIDTKNPVYKDDNFVLYKVTNKYIDKKARPLILLSGNNQQTYDSNGNAKIGSLLVLNDKGFSHANQPYETDLHQPYVAVLTYENHPEYTSSMFAESLLHCLKQGNINEFDIIGKSLGGLIALEMIRQKPSLVHHAYLMNTPIHGSILAERDFLRSELELIREYIKQHGLFHLKDVDRNIIDYVLALISLQGSREDCATTKDNAVGVKNLPNTDQFTYFCGDIFGIPSRYYGNESSAWKPYESLQRKIMELSADYMKRSRNIKSDGTVTFDYERTKQDGIDFVNCSGIDHSKLSSSGYLDFAYQKVLERNR